MENKISKKYKEHVNVHVRHTGNTWHDGEHQWYKTTENQSDSAINIG